MEARSVVVVRLEMDDAGASGQVARLGSLIESEVKNIREYAMRCV